MQEMKRLNARMNRAKGGKMKKIFYRPPDAWVGDLIPYWENGVYYGFYLHDPRKRDKEYAEMTTWHLVKTQFCGC